MIPQTANCREPITSQADSRERVTANRITATPRRELTRVAIRAVSLCVATRVASVWAETVFPAVKVIV